MVAAWRALTVVLGVAAVVVMVWLAAMPLVDARVLIVTSGSMEPTIRAGGAAAVRQTDPALVRVGDVITFQGYGVDSITTHRVVGLHDVRGRLHFQTKGDANPAPDPNLAPAQGVHGRVLFAVPHAGRILAFLSTRHGKLLVPTASGSIILLGQVRDLRRRRRPRHRTRAVVLPPVAGLTLIAASATLATTLARPATATLAAYADQAVVTPNSFSTRSVPAPTGITTTFDCGILSVGKGVVVAWNAVSGATGYDVLRSTTSGSGYITVASANAASTSYKDTTVQNSRTYYYVVRTKAGSWTSANSAESAVTTPGLLGCVL